MVNIILKYLPIALFLSNNHPEMYCRKSIAQLGWLASTVRSTLSAQPHQGLIEREGMHATHSTVK